VLAGKEHGIRRGTETRRIHLKKRGRKGLGLLSRGVVFRHEVIDSRRGDEGSSLRTRGGMEGKRGRGVGKKLGFGSKNRSSLSRSGEIWVLSWRGW